MQMPKVWRRGSLVGEEEETPEHIVFRCGNIRREKDEKGRRE